MICAGDLKVGDQVNLEGDPVFDPGCEDRFCIHLSQNAELSEVEVLDEGTLLLTFINGFEDDPTSYTGRVPPIYAFVEAQ